MSYSDIKLCYGDRQLRSKAFFLACLTSLFAITKRITHPSSSITPNNPSIRMIITDTSPLPHQSTPHLHRINSHHTSPPTHTHTTSPHTQHTAGSISVWGRCLEVGLICWLNPQPGHPGVECRGRVLCLRFRQACGARMALCRR